MNILEYQTERSQTALVLKLALPAILSQLTSVAMEYIDSAMLGRSGENSVAAVGLVTTSTWLAHGIVMAVGVGFTIQAAQLIGAGKHENVKNLIKEAGIICLLLGMLVAVVSFMISPYLPVWLGAKSSIQADAAEYFRIIMAFMPAYAVYALSSGMLQSAGAMKVDAFASFLTCSLDVVLNAFLIFEAGTIRIFGISLPGAGLRVRGAALASGLSILIGAFILLFFVLFKNGELSLFMDGKRFAAEQFFKIKMVASEIKLAVRLAVPVAMESFLMCSAYIISTKIIAPLGNVSVAAHSQAIIAESLCYMPGYGIGRAGQTLVGQSIGAGNMKLARRYARRSIIMGIGFMAFIGLLMYFFSYEIISTLSPYEDVRNMGATILKIEAFAEPLYAAAIVSSNCLRAMEDTFASSTITFSTMWVVRLPLSFILAGTMGLKGVWLAMCIELCMRGVLMLIRLWWKCRGR